MFFVIGTVLSIAFGDNGKCTEEATAVVVEMVEHKPQGHNMRRITYAPVFEYEFGGKQYTYTSSTSSYPPQFSVGEQVTIKVNPNNPNEIYYKPSAAIVMITIVFRIIGGFVAVVGVIMFIVGKAKSSPKQQL
ncbi:MAG: DUF3592 domain-containing protein [Oscillospiraceae bacterium]|nr:DUF3592 domain-containing protein [Oscillospiraceae bacterium]